MLPIVVSRGPQDPSWTGNRQAGKGAQVCLPDANPRCIPSWTHWSGRKLLPTRAGGRGGEKKKKKKKGLDRSRPAGPGVTTGGPDHDRSPDGPGLPRVPHVHFPASDRPCARPSARDGLDGLHWGHALACLCPFRAWGEGAVYVGRVSSLQTRPQLPGFLACRRPVAWARPALAWQSKPASRPR